MNETFRDRETGLYNNITFHPDSMKAFSIGLEYFNKINLHIPENFMELRRTNFCNVI